MRFALPVTCLTLVLLGSVQAYPAENTNANLANLESALSEQVPDFDMLLAGPPADCWDPDKDDHSCFQWSAEIQKHGLQANITALWTANPPEPLKKLEQYQASAASQVRKSNPSTGSEPGCVDYQGKEMEDCKKKKIACCALAWTLITMMCCTVHCDTCDIF